ncbi:MAG: hypothetical protein AAGC68_07800 [Verrucomicrobiota bacterium]
MIPRLLLLASFALTLSYADESKIYLEAGATKKLIAKEGQKIVVHGFTKNSSRGTTGANFVNFGDSEFYLVTFKSDLEQFPDGEPVDLLDGKRIAVEGVIAIYQDKPQIKLTSLDQVTILEEDAVFPPVLEKESAPATAEKPMAKEKPAPEKEKEPEEPKRKPPVDPKEFFK